VAPLKGGLFGMWPFATLRGEAGCRVAPRQRRRIEAPAAFWPHPFSFFIFPFSFSLRGSVAGKVEWLNG